MAAAHLLVASQESPFAVSGIVVRLKLLIGLAEATDHTSSADHISQPCEDDQQSYYCRTPAIDVKTIIRRDILLHAAYDIE